MDDPRTVVHKAIAFERPDRLPVAGYGVSDTTWLMPDLMGGAPADGGIDEWGCRWSVSHLKNIGQVTGHPIDDLDRLDAHPWPDAARPDRTASMAERARALEADPGRRVRFRITPIFNTCWERMQFLHGMENCLIALMEDEPGIHELADRIIDWCLVVIDRVGDAAGSSIDAMYFTDDWGSETNALISPALFRSFFLPRYRRLFAAVHDRGWRVWLHSCGRINALMPGLIEAGVDVLNMQQPLVNGIEETGDAFAGRVCFESMCDIQKTLPAGDPAKIRTEAAALLQYWGTADGGFILGDYGDAEAIGIDPSLKTTVLEAFRSQEVWSTTCSR
ncbi:MAG: uroporphyrinogen decarboxylase family protein [Planctomycetota bacterium]